MPRASGGGYTSLPADGEDSITSTGASGETDRLTAPHGVTEKRVELGESAAAGVTYTSIPIEESQEPGSVAGRDAAGGVSAGPQGGPMQEPDNRKAGEEITGKAQNDSVKKSTAEATDEPSSTTGLPTAEGIFVGRPIGPSATALTGAGGVTESPAVVRSGQGGRATVITTQVLHRQGEFLGSNGQPTILVLNNNAQPPLESWWGPTPRQVVCPSCGYSGFSRVFQVSEGGMECSAIGPRNPYWARSKNWASLGSPRVVSLSTLRHLCAEDTSNIDARGGRSPLMIRVYLQ